MSGLGRMIGQSTGSKNGLVVAGLLVVAAGGLFLVLRRSKPAGLRGAANLGQGRKFAPRGRGRVIGRVDDYGPTQKATLYVGHNKGHDAANQAGPCKKAPSKTTVAQMDRVFLRERAKQVGKDATGATRTKGKGWFRGEPEDAASYEVIYIPNDAESNYGAFRANMNRLAERMGRDLCQDSVIIVHNDGDKAKSCGAVWYDKTQGDC